MAKKIRGTRAELVTCQITNRPLTIDSIKFALELPWIELYVQSDWASEIPEHRNKIRQNILHKLRAYGVGTEAEICDLSKLPHVDGFQISISHCHKMGGFVLAKGVQSIGFDVEEITRIKPALLERFKIPIPEVSTGTGLAWVALESAFKALTPFIPLKHFGEITVSKWDLHESGSMIFDARPINKAYSLEVKGAAFSDQTLVYSVSAIKIET